VIQMDAACGRIERCIDAGDGHRRSRCHGSWVVRALLGAGHEVAVMEDRDDRSRGGQSEDTELRPGELATALTWRVSMLTDTNPISAGIGATAAYTRTPAMAGSATGGADIARGLGDAAVSWPNAAPALDAAWLASLPEPDPTPDDDMAPPPDGAGGDSEPPTDLHAVHTNSRSDHAGVIWVADGGQTATSRGALYEYPASSAVPRDRIVALNQMAADFFAIAYPDSWASGYVTTRLGDQPATAPGALNGDGASAGSVTLASFGLGYAPDTWTALIDHLRAAGATDTELTAAGLSSHASTGRLVDRFRDRLVFPITATGPDGDTEIRRYSPTSTPTAAPRRSTCSSRRPDTWPRVPQLRQLPTTHPARRRWNTSLPTTAEPRSMTKSRFSAGPAGRGAGSRRHPVVLARGQGRRTPGHDHSRRGGRGDVADVPARAILAGLRGALARHRFVQRDVSGPPVLSRRSRAITI